MPTGRQGSIRLFQFAGINVFLHWSWFLVAIYEIQGRNRHYSSMAWNALEYVGLFLIVLLHEFGHALACRQVGGEANQILLWPFGGVAYVNPPERPGATLWSITAGPLVNVVLAPLLVGLLLIARNQGWAASNHDLYILVRSILWIDIGLLIFNLLPVYPLDGGQILRSLLWFILGRARSLMVAAILGFIGIIGLIALALWRGDTWLILIAAFLLMNCWGGFQYARQLSHLARLPRHIGFACPSCKSAPPIGEFWKCAQCGQLFDAFQNHATCPHCGAQYPVTACLDCHRANPIQLWIAST